MGDPGSEEVYNEFHNVIKELQRNLTGRGLLVDVHGMVSDESSGLLSMMPIDRFC